MQEAIISILSKELSLPNEEVAALLEVPKDPKLGDFAFPCFSLAKKFNKSPIIIAKDLAGKIMSEDLEKVEAVGPYLNFFLNKSQSASSVLQQVLAKREKYGSKEGKERIMIEFPSPNTNKPLHLGHLRNMALGISISEISKSLGNKIIISNLNNDRGVHICKSMLAYQKWGNGKTPQSEKIKSDHLIGDFYVMFSKAAKENPALEEEAQEMLRKWETGDENIVALWKMMNGWALEGFKETYSSFGLKIDKEYYESEIYKEGKELIFEGLKRGIFQKRADGAIIADLSNEKLGEKVVLRSDGTSIYITQDLYLAVLKDKEFDLTGSYHVVANEQDYHFKVLFTILRKFGFKFADKLKHVSYGMVELPTGRMKSREGTVVDADDLLFETQDLAKKEILKREPDATKEDLESRSKNIALAAIKYMLLKIDPVKNIVFNPEEAISFEGNTGPYLLYTYARARSILNKAGYKPGILKTDSVTDIERNLVLFISRFPDVLEQADKTTSPNLIANYAFELAQKFNEFYHKTQVIGSDAQDFRLALVDASSQVIKNSLGLLGIPALEHM